MFEVGQLIWTIEATDDDYESAEVSAYLFMAECNDYIICCPRYSNCADFDSQLEEMYEESTYNCGCVEVAIIKKELCFERKFQADAALSKLIYDAKFD